MNIIDELIVKPLSRELIMELHGEFNANNILLEHNPNDDYRKITDIGFETNKFNPDLFSRVSYIAKQYGLSVKPNNNLIEQSNQQILYFAHNYGALHELVDESPVWQKQFSVYYSPTMLMYKSL